MPQTWIFDAHLLDQGWKRPRCQQACPTDVFEAVKLDDAEMKQKAEHDGLKVLKSDLATKPRVWYRGLDRWETCFIGGSVSAEVAGLVECIQGAKATLFQGGKPIATTLSDGFGDFRFDNLPKHGGAYRVEVSHAHGGARRDCVLGESVYLGELRLVRTEETVEARLSPATP